MKNRTKERLGLTNILALRLNPIANLHKKKRQNEKRGSKNSSAAARSIVKGRSRIAASCSADVCLMSRGLGGGKKSGPCGTKKFTSWGKGREENERRKTIN